MISSDVTEPAPPIKLDSQYSPPRQQPSLIVLDHERFAIRRGASVDLVRMIDLISVHSKRNVTRLVTRDGEICIYMPFGQIVDALRPLGVLRIHRGIAVNVAYVRRIVGRGQHHVFIVLEGGHELPVGRGYQTTLRRHLGADRSRSS